MPLSKVVYVAAHGGFAGQAVALGGGAAVANHLAAEWLRTRPFELAQITPLSALGENAPSGRDLISWDEQRYARFCREFREAATAELLRAHDPAQTAVLVNDISEAPDFASLAAAGFRITTIYHVDVVAYIAAIYAKGLVHPKRLIRWYGWVGRWMPAILQLIFENQEASLRHSRRVVAPSSGMRTTLEECYPELARGKVEVLPWGALPASGADEAFHWSEDAPPDDALVLLTLSRISPEKGQHLLLEALADWERNSTFPSRPVWLYLCGDAAYMHGQRYLARLRALASRLRRVRVVFPGYVTGARKEAFLGRADLYVFPSVHESYGLTLMEALRAGKPAICLAHEGAREIMREEFGRMIPKGSERAMRRGLREALAELARDADLRRRMGEAAVRYADERPFSAAAARLAEWTARE